jgi:hypothetical protein
MTRADSVPIMPLLSIEPLATIVKSPLALVGVPTGRGVSGLRPVKLPRGTGPALQTYWTGYWTLTP